MTTIKQIYELLNTVKVADSTISEEDTKKLAKYIRNVVHEDELEWGAYESPEDIDIMGYLEDCMWEEPYNKLAKDLLGLPYEEEDLDDDMSVEDI